jgi:hypothetical protein
MPSAHNKTKMTGDTHMPDTESEFDTQEARESTYDDKGQASDTSRSSQDRGAGSSRDSNDVPGLKDREAKTSNSYGHTRKG